MWFACFQLEIMWGTFVYLLVKSDIIIIIITAIIIIIIIIFVLCAIIYRMVTRVTYEALQGDLFFHAWSMQRERWQYKMDCIVLLKNTNNYKRSCVVDL